MKQLTTNDRLGIAIGAVVVSIPAFIMVATNDRSNRAFLAVLATVSAFAGMYSAASLWLAHSKEPPDRVPRKQPMLVVGCVSLFVLGFAPAVVWSS